MNAINRRETMFDRTKRTGYIGGGNHSMGPDFEMKSKAPAETPDPENQPPNLRDSIDSQQCCGTCSDFDGGGEDDGSGGKSSMCSKYNCPVSANQVCDSYSDKEPDNAKEMLDGPAAQNSPMGG